MFLDGLPITFLGLLGGSAVWLYVLFAGHWRAWPDLVEIDATNHVWKRTGWYPDKLAWMFGFMIVCLVSLALSGL